MRKRTLITSLSFVAFATAASAQSAPPKGALAIGVGANFAGTLGYSSIESQSLGIGAALSGGSTTDSNASALGRGGFSPGALGVGGALGLSSDLRTSANSNSSSSVVMSGAGINGAGAQLTRGFSSALAGGLGAGSISNLGSAGALNLYNQLGGAALQPR